MLVNYLAPTFGKYFHQSEQKHTVHNSDGVFSMLLVLTLGTKFCTEVPSHVKDGSFVQH